nr:MAG TPA: hypothetical protein [Caudoviricetes sp.]
MYHLRKALPGLSQRKRLPGFHVPKNKKSPDAPNGTPGDLLIQALSKHFVNAFEPVAYCRPAVMGLCCNVRQREPLNVPQ